MVLYFAVYEHWLGQVIPGEGQSRDKEMQSGSEKGSGEQQKARQQSGERGAERTEGVGGGAERLRAAERGKSRRFLHAELEKRGLHLGRGWEAEVDETRQTEVSPIHFQEGAPLTGAFGEKDKNTNHHPKCTCYFPSGVRNWIVSGVSGKCGRWAGLRAPFPTGSGEKRKWLGIESWLERGMVGPNGYPSTMA